MKKTDRIVRGPAPLTNEELSAVSGGNAEAPWCGTGLRPGFPPRGPVGSEGPVPGPAAALVR